MTLSDEQMVLEALRRVEHIESKSEKARRLGVSEGTVRRWLKGEIATPLRSDTREPLERFLTNGDGGGEEVVTADPEGTPAEQLLHMLGERAGMRRVAKELTTHDLIATAYVLARRYDFSPEELKKIDAWRDQIIADEEERD